MSSEIVNDVIEADETSSDLAKGLFLFAAATVGFAAGSVAARYVMKKIEDRKIMKPFDIDPQA